MHGKYLNIVSTSLNNSIVTWFCWMIEPKIAKPLQRKHVSMSHPSLVKIQTIFYSMDDSLRVKDIQISFNYSGTCVSDECVFM